jgi:sugar/nucleoside kinase (ribokinase family)
VWLRRRRQRIRRLENALAQARAEQAQLSRRVEMFERIAAAAGLELGRRQPTAAAEVPPPLLAAAQDARSHGASVRLDVDGREFIAVVGGEHGDPREWWAAIRHMASRLGNAS